MKKMNNNKNEEPIVWSLNDSTMGTYKKDTPNPDIGLQRFKVRKYFTVEVEFDILANSKQDAERISNDTCDIKSIEWDCESGLKEHEQVEIESENWEIDYEIDELMYKVAECVPSYEIDIHTNKAFLDYEYGEYVSEEDQWKKNEDGTDI
jgi:hypothetical protein|tara:strand:- start:2476 stop:2925 length:450 start_codon:yes stop_codon:yes gene_type:complete